MVCVIAWLRGAAQRCFFAYHPGFFFFKVSLTHSLPGMRDRKSLRSSLESIRV